MNINKKLIVSFVFFSIFILSVLNIKNPEKTKFNAIDIIKKLVTLIGGQGGGGRPELAQGGGPDRSGVKKIIKKIEELI